MIPATRALAMILICGTLVPFGPTARSDGKNIALIITDNQSWYDVGCYGNKVIKTPHMDQLATEGVRFRQAFATVASCGASRAVIYSGVLTHRNGQYAHPHREHNQEIREEIVTVFEALKEKDYRTALIGKQHVRPVEKYPVDPLPSGKSVASSAESRDVIAMAKVVDEFIGHDTEKPFFLSLSLGDPHPISRDGVAWGVTESHSPGYQPVEYNPADITVPGFLPDTPAIREQLAGYYQQVSRADYGVGLLVESLKKHGKYNDTLIVFVSDHGTSEPGAMGTHYDPGVRAPFIIRKPGGPAGLVHEAVIAFTDITPTILDWAGIANPTKGRHGRSLLPILDQPNVAGWDEVVLSHVAHEIYSYYPMRTLRDRRYKLIWNVTWRAEYPLPIDTWERRTWRGLMESKSTMFGPRTIDQYLHRPQIELYDLETDPWEVQNLADEPVHAERRKQMTERLLERLVATEDPWLLKYHPER